MKYLRLHAVAGLKYLSIILVVLLPLISCGGSSGGGGSDPGPTANPQFSISRNQVSFNAVEADTTFLDSEIVTGRVVDYTGAQLYIIVEVLTNTGVKTVSVQVTGTDQGTLYIVPHQPTTLGRGVYTDSIRVNACEDASCSRHLGGSPQTINVTYTVTEGGEYTPDVTQLVYEARRMQSGPAQTVDFDYNSVVSSWVAEIDYHDGSGWLSATPDSGEIRAGTPVTISLTAAGLEAGLYHADLVVRSESGVVSTRVPVTYLVQEADVQYVSPYVAISGESKKTIIRGIGFNDSTVSDVRFGDASASSFSVLSDTEIVATYPSLAAGAYPVSVINATQTIVGNAALVVVDPQTYAGASLGSSHGKDKIIYDATRQCLYVQHKVGFNQIEKIDYDGADWVQSDLLDFNLLMDIDLTPDGKSLVLVAQDSLYYLDPDTMATTRIVNSPEGVSFSKAAFANDGDLIICAAGGVLYRYHPDMDVITTIPLGTPLSITDGIHASANRDKLVLTSNPAMVLDSSDYTLVETDDLGQSISTLRANRDGSGILRAHYSTGYAYYCDGDLNPLGNLPREAFISLEFSPNGTKAYMLDNLTLHTFDLTQPDGSGGFVEIGSPVTLIGSPGANQVSTISPDGNTFFVTGSTLVVQPLP